MFRDLRRTYRKYQRLQNIQQADFAVLLDLPMADTLLEQSYQKIIKKTLQAWQDERADQRKINTDRDDYYTLWTHQIKTPIYAMKMAYLLTGNDDAPVLSGMIIKCLVLKREERTVPFHNYMFWLSYWIVLQNTFCLGSNLHCLIQMNKISVLRH